MKVIVTGASGYVATNVIIECLRAPHVTTVIAVSRSPVPVPEVLPEGADPSKLKSVVVPDYVTYSTEVKREFAGAHACIWTVGVVPAKMKTKSMKELKLVHTTSALAGLKAMVEAGPAKPFRFVYLNGFSMDRDAQRAPRVLRHMEHILILRAETEREIVAFAAQHKDVVEASIARLAMVEGNKGKNSMMQLVLKWAAPIPMIDVTVLSAALLDQVTNGFVSDPILHADLDKIGKKALEKSG